MASSLASHADALAILIQKDRDGHERAGKKREERARPTDTEVAIRGSSEEGERSAEHGTNEVISRKDARSVRGICVCQVVQDDILWSDRRKKRPFSNPSGLKGCRKWHLRRGATPRR